MAEELFRACASGKKELLLVPGARHAAAGAMHQPSAAMLFPGFSMVLACNFSGFRKKWLTFLKKAHIVGA